MSKIDDGGPAYPVDDLIMRREGKLHGAPVSSAGMSLRDYFAGQALAGMLANPDRVGAEVKFNGWAGQAYYFADAMIIARRPPTDESAE